jgi:copper oxidase (laccase) domain-containing protein
MGWAALAGDVIRSTHTIRNRDTAVKKCFIFILHLSIFPCKYEVGDRAISDPAK